MRIVSLLPSATEVLCALGAQDEIVGVSHDSDYPPDVRQKPLASTSIVSDDRSSVEIDGAVGQTYHRGASIYHVDADFLRRERPDLIIAQELCEVCAVTSEEARRAAGVARIGARILSLEPSTLAEALECMRVLGGAIGRQSAAEVLVASLEARASAVAERLAAVASRPSVLCLGWLDPLVVEGHWLPEMVTLAGGRDAFGRAGARSRRIEWSEVVAAGPEAILVTPCSFPLERTLAEAHLLGELPGWEDLPAARAGRVYAVDSAYFSRPGPRLIDGLEILARCLHPEQALGPPPAGAAARLPAGAHLAAAAFVPVT